MPVFDVTFTCVLRITDYTHVRASDEDLAEERARELLQNILDTTTVAWKIAPDLKHVTWELEEEVLDDAIEVTEV